MPDAARGLGWDLARVDSAGRGWQHLAQGDLGPGDVFGSQGLQIRADEAAEEGGTDVVRVPL